MRAAARRLLGGLQCWVPARPGGIAILAYHLVGGGTDSPVDLPLETFRRHLDVLAEVPVISLDAALRRLRDSAEDDATAVVLTFDDAYRNFVDRVVPLLDDAGLPATLYVPVGFVDGSAPAPLSGAEDLPAASWSALCDLAAGERIALGSHSLTHRDLPRLPPADVRDELVGSRTRLEDRLGVPVPHFCYPRGRVDRTTVRMARETYSSAVTGGGRRARPGVDLLRLPRFPIRRDGPGRLSSLWTDEVWLEEWAADRVRRFL